MTATAGGASGNAELLVRLAGPLAVLRGGVPLTGAELGSRKARQLLRVLAAEAGHAVPVSRLVESLWPGEEPKGATENVATLVSRLRKALGPAIIEGSREQGYRLGQPPDVQVDLDLAETWSAQAQSRLTDGETGLALLAAERAMELLGESSLAVQESDEDWAHAVEERLISLRRKASLALSSSALAAGEAARAADVAAAALAADPYDEAACRLVMRAAAALGEPGRGLAAYAGLRDRLAEELGTDPAAETQAAQRTWPCCGTSRCRPHDGRPRVRAASRSVWSVEGRSSGPCAASGTRRRPARAP